MAKPIFQLAKTTSDTYYDLSDWVAELNITHEELDTEKSGRDKDTGIMKRTYVSTKHTLAVKMVNHLPPDIVDIIHDVLYSSTSRVSFRVKWRSPCVNEGIWDTEMYCATINYGAQRYDRMRDEIFYDGTTFTCIQM